MRPVALGRKNRIPIGSPQAGPKIAALLSLVESCRRLKLPVRDYLAAVLPGFADLPVQRLPNLTPTAWVAQHAQTQTTEVSVKGDFRPQPHSFLFCRSPRSLRRQLTRCLVFIKRYSDETGNGKRLLFVNTGDLPD